MRSSLFCTLALLIFATVAAAECNYDNGQSSLHFPTLMSFYVEGKNTTNVSVWINNVDNHNYYMNGTSTRLTLTAEGQSDYTNIASWIFKGQTIGPINLTIPVKPEDCKYLEINFDNKELEINTATNLTNELKVVCPGASSFFYDGLQDTVCIN